MKLLSSIIFTLVLSVGVYASEEFKLPEGERYFTEGIFDSYHDQLTTFMHEEVEKYPELTVQSDDPYLTQVLQFIEYIFKPIPDTAEAKRIYHTTMLQTMRSLIAQIDVLDGYAEVSLFLGELAEWMYTGVDLWDAQTYFISENVPFSAFEDDSKNIAVLFDEIYEHLKGLPQFGGSIVSVGKDTHLKGDLPSALFTFDQTKIIRTALTIRDMDWAEKGGENPEVIQEYKQFLRHYASKGKTNLYVNLITTDEQEIHAVRAIQELEFDPAFQDAIIVVRLDRNSPFYKQANALEIQNADAFMKEFFETLMNPSWYSWSQRLRMDEWKEALQIMISEVHHGIFQAKSVLTLDERKQFIDLVNLKIVTTLIDRFHPDSANISCRSTVDRGPSLYTLLYLYSLGPKEQLSFEEKRMASTMLFAPGLLARNRLQYYDKVGRVLRVINLLHQAKNSV